VLSLGEADLEAQFRFAFSRMGELNLDQASTHYDPTLHFIYLGPLTSSIDFILNIRHEMTHAALGESLLGMTIETLDAIGVWLAAVIGSELNPVTRRHLDAVPESTRALFFKETRDLAERRKARRAALFTKETLSEIRALYTKESFAGPVRALKHVETRRRELLKSWRVCQEGIASFIELNDRDGEEYERLIGHYFRGSTPEQRASLREAVEEEAKDRRRRLDDDDARMPLPYRQGYRICREIAERTGSVYAPLVAAELASHFPYHRCDLIAASDEAFARDLESIRLGADQRFRALATMPDLVLGAMRDAKGEREALEYLGGDEAEPLSAEAIDFEGWEKRHLWKEAANRAGLNWTLETSGSMAHDFRYHLASDSSNAAVPVFVTEDGKILHANPEFRKIFMQRYVKSAGREEIFQLLQRVESAVV